jgi:hypothetical protein
VRYFSGDKMDDLNLMDFLEEVRNDLHPAKEDKILFGKVFILLIVIFIVCLCLVGIILR